MTVSKGEVIWKYSAEASVRAVALALTLYYLPDSTREC